MQPIWNHFTISYRTSKVPYDIAKWFRICCKSQHLNRFRTVSFVFSADDLNVHGRKAEDAVKETARITIPVKRAAKKLRVAEEILKFADGERTLKQTKDASKGKSQHTAKTSVSRSKRQRDKIKNTGYSSSAKKSKRVYKLGILDKHTA